MTAIERPERMPVEARRLDTVGAGQKRPRAIAAIRRLDAEAGKRIKMRPGYEGRNFLLV